LEPPNKVCSGKGSLMKSSPCTNFFRNLAVVLFLLIAATASAGDNNSGYGPDVAISFSRIDTLMLPSPGKISGLTWMGPDTLVVLNDIPDSLSESGDREVRLIFLDREGETLRVEDFTGVLHRGLAWDGEFLFSCGDADDGSSILYRIEPDTLMVEEAFDAPGNHPSGMCFDGRFIWITDRDTGRVDRFDNEVGEITRSVVTPGFSPFGVTFDGKYMWITDSGSGRMYRLTGARRRWSATVDTDSYLMRGSDVLLLHDGASFWYVPEGENMAVRIEMP
jgi:hypothetical protein